MAVENLSNRPASKPSFEKGPSIDDKELKDVTGAISESIGTSEGMEFIDAMGNVAERVGKISENQGGGAGVKVKKDDRKAIDPEEIKAKLLKNIPSKREMKKQIIREIQKEIKYLHKRATKMSRAPGNVSYFEMSNVIRKIRELRGLLGTLLKASMDSLKSLWLKFVHGIM